MSTTSTRRPSSWLPTILGLVAAAGLAACGAATSGLTAGERDNVEESSTEALQSANDAASAGGSARAATARMASRLAPVPVPSPTALPAVCLTGSATSSSTQQDADTGVHVITYAACEVRAGHIWDGNQTVTTASTGATSSTVAVVNALTETVARGLFTGARITIATTTPIRIETVGEPSTGTVTRTLTSGVDHRERHSAAGALVHSVDVTFDGMVIVDTFGAADSSGDYPLMSRVATGAQSVHHLLWKVTIGIAHAATTWQPVTCSCTPVSGSSAHTLVWDDSSRTLALTRTNLGCGTWDIVGTDTKNSRKIDETFAATCP